MNTNIASSLMKTKHAHYNSSLEFSLPNRFCEWEIKTHPKEQKGKKNCLHSAFPTADPMHASPAVLLNSTKKTEK